MKGALTFEQISERISAVNEEAMLPDRFDDALLGLVERAGSPPVALYDQQKCIEILMKRDSMSLEAARRFFAESVADVWVGDGTPAYATLMRRALPVVKTARRKKRRGRAK